MSGIGTKNVKAAGSTGGLPKSISPGNVEAFIYNVEFATYNYAKGPKAFVLLYLETAPIGDGFEGWKRDKDDDSKGRHLGQTAIVKSDPFGWEDKTYQNREYTVVDSVVGFIKAICEEIGSDWCDKVDGKYKTIEEFVEGFAKDAPYKDIMLHWCIGGTKEIDEKGYPKYWPYLPTMDKAERAAGKKLFTSAQNVDKLLKFDPIIHVYSKKGADSVQNFSAPAETQSAAPKEDLPWKTEGDAGHDPFNIDGAMGEFAKTDDPFAVAPGSSPAQDDPFAVKA